jgi:hypothetical protein
VCGHIRRCLLVVKLETHLDSDVDFRLTNRVEVLILVGCSVEDGQDAEYVSVSVSLSKLQ